MNLHFKNQQIYVMKLILIIITLVVIAVLWIIWQVKKVPILSYISKYSWGLRIVKNEYFKVMFSREQKRLKKRNKIIELAKIRNKIENLKIYVIEIDKNFWWYGTCNEFSLLQKKNKKLSGMWPLRDAVFQTR